jgi:hypothetical protein
MQLNTLRACLRGVCAYRDLMETNVMTQVTALLDSVVQNRGEQALDAYTALFYALRQAGYTGLGDWLWDELRYRASPYGRLAEGGGSDPALENTARREVENFVILAETDCDQLIAAMGELLDCDYASVLAGLPRWTASAPFDFERLTAFYREKGCGLFAQYQAFVWDRGELIPVDDPDCPRPEELLGYELQRNQVVANTRSMLEGNRVNNVLLFGDGGTGKSATVKSMLYLPGFGDLRLIEVQKEGLAHMPSLIRTLAGRRQKFILFIDDLAFDQDDNTYSVMKTILEGGLERRPANVAIYATSNRRHLVRQSFSDRAGDEVDAFETISEKTALAERFGLRIPYLTMSKNDYLALVDHLARLAGVEKEPDLLHAQAMTWEIRHSGRTPRTAQQFIASLKL